MITNIFTAVDGAKPYFDAPNFDKSQFEKITFLSRGLNDGKKVDFYSCREHGAEHPIAIAQFSDKPGEYGVEGEHYYLDYDFENMIVTMHEIEVEEMAS